MEVTHTENGVNYIIDFELTGDVIDIIDCYDHEEVAEGLDQFGNEWGGSAIVSCGEVQDVECIEMC